MQNPLGGSRSAVVVKVLNGRNRTMRHIRGELLSEANGIARVKLMNQRVPVTVPLADVTAVNRPRVAWKQEPTRVIE